MRTAIVHGGIGALVMDESKLFCCRCSSLYASFRKLIKSTGVEVRVAIAAGEMTAQEGRAIMSALKEVAGSDHNFRLDEFSETMRSRIVSAFSDALASSAATFRRLCTASRLSELGPETGLPRSSAPGPSITGW